MAMPATRADWTVEMLDALPEDGQRYEIIDGALFVTPAPGVMHQDVAGFLYVLLREYLRRADIGRAKISPSDVRRGDRRRNRVQPDVFAVRLIDGKLPPYPFEMSDLLLAVEVPSPSDPAYDYHTKRELYLSGGVPEYWVVNAEARIVSRWRTVDDPGEVFSERLTWQPDGMPAPLVLELPAVFEDALG